jgi:crotonobetainyl-CoA:carnitine CoA-transferase CaiB-like acyl-CoA transferase
VAGWTKDYGARELAAKLGAAGVPASPVNTTAMLYDDPHLRARGFYEMVAHAVAGDWEVDGMPYRYPVTPAHVRLPPPSFGQHNDYVLRDLLRLSDEEVEELKAEGIIGDEPARAGAVGGI